MAFDRSGPPRGGSKGNTGRGGPPSRPSSSRGGPSRGGFGGGAGRGAPSRGGPSRGGQGGGFGRDRDDRGGERSFSDRPKRDFGDRPAPRGDRPFNDRPKRDFGDRPRGDRPFGDRPRPSGDRPFNDRPKRDFGDRPRGDRPFGDRPRPSGDRPFNDRPKRDFGDRPRPSGDRPFNDRPKRDFGDRPQRSFNDAPREEVPFEDRPRRSFQRDGFGASRPRDNDHSGERRSHDDRPPRTERREYSSSPDRKFSPRGGDDRRPAKREGFEKRPRLDEEGNAIESAVKGHEMVVYGVHATQAALRNTNRKVTAIWVTDIGHDHLTDAFDATRHPEAETMERRDIERRLPAGAVHQGIAAAVEPLNDVFLSDILSAALLPNAERQVIVVLDEVTDPHNVGAVLRSMSMFGAKAMVVHKRNAPSVTGVMAKIATGAVEHIPMVPVTNISQAIQELQTAGFYCLGLDENADISIDEAPKTGHIALVLGNEGEGLRAKTRTTCDTIASIASLGQIKSLNVSNAAAIALYSITRKA